MMNNIIVNYKDILNTYPKSERILIYKYRKAKRLVENGYKISEISKILNVPIATIYRWKNLKSNPYSLNCIKRLSDLGLLPLKLKNNAKLRLIIKLFAYVLTDGTMSKRLANIKVCGEFEDLELLSKKIKDIFPEVRHSIISQNTKGILEDRKIEGVSHYIQMNSVALGRLLYVLGAPKGDKVKQIMDIPDWVFQLDVNLKKLFLGILWSAEGSKPIKTNSGGYNLSFTMAKDVKLINHHIKFLNQIKSLFKEINIETTRVKIKKNKTKRKDGIMSQNCYFYIRSNYKNFIKFCEEIPLFSIKKRQRLDIAYNYYKRIYDRKKKRKILKKDILYKANKMISFGHSVNYISKKLNIPRTTLRYWLGDKS